MRQPVYHERAFPSRRVVVVASVAAALIAGFVIGESTKLVQGQAANAGFPAVAGYKGGLDVLSGPYEVVPNWPKPLSQLPGHDNWTWGAVQGVFAESPDRVYMLVRGELPNIKRPEARAFPELGPSLSFPVGQAPFRNASQGMVASPPGAGGPGADPEDPAQAWKGRMGIDARWEHTVLVFNQAGDIVEQWTQWDKMLRRPHSVYINPYDAEKHVWIVDDHSHAIFKFTHDGKTLVQTIGTPNKAGADATHFNRPTFLTWLPDSTMFVADGYNGTRVAKFDKYDFDGHFLYAWGTLGDHAGGFFNMHGASVDQQGNLYVAEVGNGRLQKFRPRSGANKAFLVGPPVYAAWR